jgi:hypothetical protein
LRIAVVGEGLTEYHCVPTVAGRLGNDVIRQVHFRGSNAGFDWDQLFRKRIAPLVTAVATAGPDKIVVVLDREDRTECPGDLAKRGLAIILEECGYCLEECSVAVIVANKEFETILFADYSAVDSLQILKGPVSQTFPATTDAQNVLSWLKGYFRSGHSYDKPRDGKSLAQKINLTDAAVQNRSRALRKLIKELTPPALSQPALPPDIPED